MLDCINKSKPLKLHNAKEFGDGKDQIFRQRLPYFIQLIMILIY